MTEGRAREAIWRDGRWWDEIHMSVLEPDWRAASWQAGAVADGRVTGPDGPATTHEGEAAVRRGGG